MPSHGSTEIDSGEDQNNFKNKRSIILMSTFMIRKTRRSGRIKLV
jgi:hypothetical protein